MTKDVRIQVSLYLDESEEVLRKKAAEALSLPQQAIMGFYMERKSVDARKNNVKILYTLIVTVSGNARLPENVPLALPVESIELKIGTKELSSPPVIIGAGPCGLFTALALAQKGYKPIVLERGEDVAKRKEQVERFFRGGTHNEENNVLFGDGGAGAFSDGKLTARGRDEYGNFVLRTLSDHGAPKDIHYLNKPHIGTDVLTGVIQSIKKEIKRLGATWINGAKVTGLRQKDGRLVEVVYEKGGQRIAVPCECAVLAIGHSARDTFFSLHEEGIAMTFKPFAAGLRIEHPQRLIDEAQYGRYAGHEKLGAADYALTAKYGDRGVYTFCMCPGGFVVPSVSEAGHLCVNGMSYHRRDGQNANAAVVVQVAQHDCGSDALDGIRFQRQFEKKAYELTHDYLAPVQMLSDFFHKRKGSKLGAVKPSYPRGFEFVNLWDCLPDFIANGIAVAMAQFDQKLHGFSSKDAVLTGVEMRTSSPVRILRNEKRQSESMAGVYPAGEGAGYAGGIISSAADGLRTAFAIMEEYAPLL